MGEVGKEKEEELRGRKREENNKSEGPRTVW